MRHLNLNSRFTALYVGLGTMLAAIEIVGVVRDGSGDTISELYWWSADRVPIGGWPLHLVLLAGLGWLAAHLIGGSHTRAE